MELDVIHCKDAKCMDEVDDRSIQLIITSPPYNVGKPYESIKALEEYLDFLNDVWEGCVGKLCEGGRIAVNVANTLRQPYIPLHGYIIKQMLDLGLIMRGEIIWDKGPSVGVSTAWGSFASASNPTLRDTHEYILVFSRDSLKLEETRGDQSGIDNLDFVEWTKSIWGFDTESPERVGHPAPFPVELPKRLILLYTNVGDIVLDPFMGSGTTAVAAKMLRRFFIGYEIKPEYCEIARRRVADLEKVVQLSFNPIWLPQSSSSRQIPSPYKEIAEKNYRKYLLGELTDRDLEAYFNKCFEDIVTEADLYACWVCVNCLTQSRNIWGWGEKPDTCPTCGKPTTFAVATFQAWAPITGEMFEWACYRLLKERFNIQLIPTPSGEEFYDFILPPKTVIEMKGSPSYIRNPDDSRYFLGRPGLQRSDTRKKAFANVKGFKSQNPDCCFLIVTNACPANLQDYSNRDIYRVRDVSKASELKALVEELRELKED